MIRERWISSWYKPLYPTGGQRLSCRGRDTLKDYFPSLPLCTEWKVMVSNLQKRSEQLVSNVVEVCKRIIRSKTNQPINSLITWTHGLAIHFHFNDINPFNGQATRDKRVTAMRLLQRRYFKSSTLFWWPLVPFLQFRSDLFKLSCQNCTN